MRWWRCARYLRREDQLCESNGADAPRLRPIDYQPQQAPRKTPAPRPCGAGVFCVADWPYVTCRRAWPPWGRVSRQLSELGDLMRAVQGQVTHLSSQMEAALAAIDNLQAADTSLKSEVVTFIADWQQQLANSSAANDAAVQSVADDMNSVVTQLQASDPSVTPPAPSN